ncbi:MAG: hypothetical protein SGCHY_001823 [Lobulomycetales sp.]
MKVVYQAPLASTVRMMKRISAATLASNLALSPLMALAPSASLGMIAGAILGALGFVPSLLFPYSASVSGGSTVVINYCLQPYIFEIARLSGGKGDLLSLTSSTVFGNRMVTLVHARDLVAGAGSARAFASWTLPASCDVQVRSSSPFLDNGGEMPGLGQAIQFLEKPRKWMSRPMVKRTSFFAHPSLLRDPSSEFHQDIVDLGLLKEKGGTDPAVAVDGSGEHGSSWSTEVEELRKQFSKGQ